MCGSTIKEIDLRDLRNDCKLHNRTLLFLQCILKREKNDLNNVNYKFVIQNVLNSNKFLTKNLHNKHLYVYLQL